MEIRQCMALEEVRAEIDRIDSSLVKLIAERSAYVKQAAAFKTDAGQVKAPGRVEKVIAGVREKALQSGTDPDIVEAVYRTMIDCFINMEKNELEKNVKEGK